MTKVLLINQEKIPHYRIPIYNHLSAYLKKENYVLTIISGGIEEENSYKIEFDHKEIHLSFFGLASVILGLAPDIIIYWVRLRHLYLFPTLLLIKILRKKAIYWGHGSDLEGNKAMWLKKIANSIEYFISDAIILYSKYQRKYIKSLFHKKIFIANNTLCYDNYAIKKIDKRTFLAKYNITTGKNIIFMGRLQKRKRIEDLLKAFALINRRNVGLILVGPDTDGILRNFHADNIYRLDPIYGYERLDLLTACDVYCLPGWVGLSIVDAFYCGLPVVTELGEHAPEIMYLKEGINGFMVPKGDVQQLANKLQLLLEDDVLRGRFSHEARKEINTNGHIDMMCKGFSDALRFVCYNQKGMKLKENVL